MNIPEATTSLRPFGLALLITIIVFMIGAFSAAYFRPPLPTTPLEQLQRIANDRPGWTAQAIIFPVSFLAITAIFGSLATNLPGGWPRWLAILATLLSGAAFLLWLAISLNRLHLGAQAAELIANYDPNTPLPVLINFNTFWPYTFCALGSMALMGAALALAGVLPALGWVVAGLSAAAALFGGLVWRDWPPFMSYIILLVLAVGLMRVG
ncbi:MAG: hypothetical protein IPM53_26495 [Anaerolineaceae bacterium]|nr:hypothetical protein [Anaerolineaceae bacterium]